MTEFKLIVAGSRDFNDYPMLHKTLDDLANGIYETKAISIVSGMARGADHLACIFAKANEVKLYEFPADWDKYGKRAGYVRNDQMAHFSDGLVAFWDGESRGTAHMIQTMQAMGKPVHTVRY